MAPSLNSTFSAPGLPADLLRAYRRARYRVLAQPRAFVLKVGRASPPLLALLRARGAECALGITAHNPAGRRPSAAANAAAQSSLRRDLESLGLALLEGVGEDPGGRWPDEPFFLVLGLDRHAGLALARDYGQNAVLFAGADAVPRLAF
jgi:hypothetical protein